MRKRHTSRYIFSLLLLWGCAEGFAQQKQAVKKDTIIYKTGYGIRVGLDLSKPIKSFLDPDYKGLELVADYRIKKNWYIASELGFERNISNEDFINTTSKGSYIRIGANYNTYKNWLDMTNEVFIGLRYGFSLFQQTLNRYTPSIRNSYFQAKPVAISRKNKGLTAHWTEFQLGVKAEIFNNLFVTLSASYKIMISVKDPPGFKSLYAPGFNRIYQSNTGFGFNYTLSYLIPFIKK